MVKNEEMHRKVIKTFNLLILILKQGSVRLKVDLLIIMWCGKRILWIKLGPVRKWPRQTQMVVVYSMKGAAGMDLACYHTAGQGQAQVSAASLHLIEEVEL